jgi:hypothetical protein
MVDQTEGRVRKVLGCLSIVVLQLAVVGCQRQPAADPNRTTVSGQVIFNGQPLKAGAISFESSEKAIASTATIKNGNYSTDRAPIGHLAVSVDTTSVKYGDPGSYVKIPAKYADTGTSGLTAEVKPGVNENVNFDLKP